MRALHWVDLDRWRPALLHTRPEALAYLRQVTVAPVVSTVRGIGVEVPVGPEQGLDHDSVVNVDHVTTVDRRYLGQQIGVLTLAQEVDVLRALREAFGLLA